MPVSREFKMYLRRLILISCLTVIHFRTTFANVKFDHTNCMEMKPHIRVPTKSNSFVLAYARIYSVYITSSNFKAGSPIKVVIKSCLSGNGVVHGMKAFLLQARTLDTKFLPVGHFNRTHLQPDADAISCYYPYDSLVNKYNKNLKELTAMWIPPRDYKGTIAFYLTVIPHGTHSYYLRVKSPPLTPGNGTSISLHAKCPSSSAAETGQHKTFISFISFIFQIFIFKSLLA